MGREVSLQGKMFDPYFGIAVLEGEFDIESDKK